MSRKKRDQSDAEPEAEVEDLSQPTEHDLSEPPEFKTLTYDLASGSIVGVLPEGEEVKAPKSEAIPRAAVLELVNALATRCMSGWSPSLEHVRELQADIDKL